MSKVSASKKRSVSKVFRQPTWEELIADGQAEIARAEERVSRLKRAVQSFEEMRAEGLPFARVSKNQRESATP
jgi:hypothetical protein